MASPAKKTARSADVWLVNGSDGDESVDAKSDEKSQWLVQPETELNGDKGTEAAQSATEQILPGQEETRRSSSKAPAKADKALEELRAENRELAKRVRELQSELRVEAKQVKADAAEALKQREAELTKRFDKRETELSDRIEELESALADGQVRRKRGRSHRKTGQLDLNQASFEELRDLGLSVTQSARLIAYRDVRGGYQSLDELADIPGLPSQTRSELRKKLTLSI